LIPIRRQSKIDFVNGVRVAGCASNGSRGTTLIEVMVAAIVLVFGLLTFLSMMFSAQKISSDADETRIAMYVLQEAMEESLSVDFDTMKTAGKFMENPFDPWLVPQLKDGAIKVAYLVPLNLPDLNTYQIKLTWTDSEGKPKAEALIGKRSKS
jgi:Tfp pilus assembly protein PilV